MRGDGSSTSVPAFPPDSDAGSDLGSRLASMRSMPGITIEFTEQELAELRAEAKEKGVAIKRLAHDILTEDVVRRRQKQRFVEGAVRFAMGYKAEFEREFPEGLR